MRAASAMVSGVSALPPRTFSASGSRITVGATQPSEIAARVVLPVMKDTKSPAIISPIASVIPATKEMAATSASPIPVRLALMMLRRLCLVMVPRRAETKSYVTADFRHADIAISTTRSGRP